ncbi:MAG TPA: sodium-dependent bicarbonate transport family permease, partial [Chitinophagales bacterium]|nr:sodium-dependent bicarbonate transport family permease [Chitinophagales bacterium]
AIFMLEMGIVASARFADLKKVGISLILFGVMMPLIGASIGILAGNIVGLSVGGTAVLATMCASASYIAAPAAMRIAIPDANPTYSLTAALGITFPFNIIIGVNLYYRMSVIVDGILN